MKYKLVPGKWCSECAFGENHSGIIVCVKHNKECIPGETVYKEVPATNGDKIRAMSNEELATFFDSFSPCPPDAPECQIPSNIEQCRKCWLNWLNAEAKEEE